MTKIRPVPQAFVRAVLRARGWKWMDFLYCIDCFWNVDHVQSGAAPIKALWDHIHTHVPRHEDENENAGPHRASFTCTFGYTQYHGPHAVRVTRDYFCNWNPQRNLFDIEWTEDPDNATVEEYGNPRF